MIIPVVTEDMIYFSKLKSLTNENYELLHIKRPQDMDKLNLDKHIIEIHTKNQSKRQTPSLKDTRNTGPYA